MWNRALLGALLLSLSPLAKLPDAQAQSRPTMRPEIRAARGIVGAGRHFSVEAGMRMFYAGGNAVDAGVASVFAAAVCEISHFGFGGEVPILIHDPRTGKTVAISGQGTAPAAAQPSRFAGQKAIPANGPLAATVPAVLDALSLALEHYGTLRLGQVMQPAIELADGFPMYAYLQSYLVSERQQTEKYPAAMAAYYAGGKTPQVGEVFRQPDLAATLRAIVAAEKQALDKGRPRAEAIRAGRDAFYKGEIARRIAAAVQQDGGLLSHQDLAGYAGRIEEPVSTTFHGFQVYKCGPWSQGPVLLQSLNLLEGFDLREMGHGSTEYLHTVTEALKLAYDDREAHYGDPAFVRVPLSGLLSKQYAAERRKLIDRRRAEAGHRPGDPYPFERASRPTAVYRLATPHAGAALEVGDTTCVNAVDASGLLFSATPSSGWLLGGAYVAGDTGVPLGNRMQVFSPDPGSHNVLAGGKRPRTTLTPTIVLREGKPFLAISTPGGDSQDQQILNVLLSLLVFNMGLQEAVEAPRFNSQHPFSSFGGHESQPLLLEVEDRIAPGVIEALQEKGHQIRLLGPFGMSTGITAVGVDPVAGTLRGAADPRRERYISGW